MIINWIFFCQYYNSNYSSRLIEITYVSFNDIRKLIDQFDELNIFKYTYFSHLYSIYIAFILSNVKHILDSRGLENINVYSEYIQKPDVIALDGTYHDEPSNVVIYHD